MAPTIGVNLRVTGHCNQGGRKHMEDMFSVAYQQTEDEKDLEYAYFGIFDGHGGREAASFAKEHLMDSIVSQKKFWSDDDEDVMKAIRDGFISTHYAMWRELEKWPKTMSGLPSTSGTTASIAFIRKGKIYIGHVGDSSVVIGYQNKGETEWMAKSLTRDHKPESEDETDRIKQCGGKVVYKSGVPRVVWNRPRIGHKGPVRRSTHIDEIPFLAVARSLGDLWSYNSALNQFVVSPEPDVEVIPVDISKHRCLILGTDGLWNMLSPQAAVDVVHATECHNVLYAVSSSHNLNWINPSKRLVDTALEKWNSSKLIADNTSVVTLMLDPPGPPRAQVLRKQQVSQSHSLSEPSVHGVEPVTSSPSDIQNTSQMDESPRTSSARASPSEEHTSDSGYNGTSSTGGVVIFTRYPSPPQQNMDAGNLKGSDNNKLSSTSQSHQSHDGSAEGPSSGGSDASGRVREVGDILHGPSCSQKHDTTFVRKTHRLTHVQKSQEPPPGGSGCPPLIPNAGDNQSPEIQSNEVSSSLSEDKCKSHSEAVSINGAESNVPLVSSGQNFDATSKHKKCWFLRRRTRSEDRYSNLAKTAGPVNDVLNECVAWPSAASQPDLVKSMRRRLLSMGDMGKAWATDNNFAQSSGGMRCCGQRLGLSVSKAERRRAIITPRRGRSRPLDPCAADNSLNDSIPKDPVMNPAPSDENAVTLNNGNLPTESRVIGLTKSCRVVLQRSPMPPTLLKIRRHSQKKRNSLSIRQNPVPKSMKHPQVHCGNGGALRRSWASGSCPKQGPMITRSRRKDDA
ncbi:probable protein phosphatase 2C 20 isoform X2 [Ischnura elegans]|uniref:probable protein phosphatase 2C 20 isoform X2 n=1 Tax=Ischnura elegans TaxID=197161 RepID=UPI001ED8813D|nr:probable protein phosphatase 2C 20 isoform X2 [Ischnura elegans]